MNLKNIVVHFRLFPVLLLASALVLGDRNGLNATFSAAQAMKTEQQES